jgi:thiol-disulfide isomerase/thioredoxin
MFGQGPVLQIDPSCPVASGIDEETKEIHFTYYPQSPAAKIRDPHDLKLEVGVNGRFWRDNTRTVPFVRGDDGTWQAALSHKNQDDVWFYLIFQVRDGASGAVDDNSGLYWDAVACNSDGSQNESGVQSEAESYTGTRFDNGIGRQRDYGKAIAVLDEFMHREPAQGYGLLPFYWDYKVRLYGRDDAGWKKVSTEVSHFTDEHQQDKDALRGAFYFVLNHEDHLPPELYPRIMSYLEATDPEEAAKLERTTAFNRLRHERDTRKQADGLAEFIRKYPSDPQAPNAGAWCFMALRTLHDVAGAEELFPKLVELDPGWADTYATMAAIYLENEQKPEQSLKLLDNAEQLFSPKFNSRHNLSLTLSVDDTQVASTLAFWRARAYLLQGNAELALPLAKKALEDRKSSERYFVLGQAFESVGQKEKAVDAYLAAIARTSSEAPAQRERLEKLWLSGGFGTKEQLEQKLKTQDDEAFRKVNYVPKLVDEPVREYEFTTLKGEKFRSSDLGDKTVILNFWGTWCGPCLPELPGFQELQQKHPDLIVAALAVSSERKNIDRVVADEKLNSLRIAQSDSLGDVFANRGVPVTYVIDHGRVRVVHHEALSNVMNYIEADLASLKQAASLPRVASSVPKESC